MLGVTARKASHNASNARGVTVGKMGCNSSIYNGLKKFIFLIKDCSPRKMFLII